MRQLKTLSLYTASALRHAPLWRQLSVDWPEVSFSARWPFTHCTKNGEPLWPESFAPVFWEQDLEDIRNSDLLLCYAAPSDTMRGALVECGVALALRKRVILCGNNPGFGTWQHHPLVLRVEGFPAARSLLSLLAIE